MVKIKKLKLVILFIVILALIIGISACGDIIDRTAIVETQPGSEISNGNQPENLQITEHQPESAPQLEVILLQDGVPEQRVIAAQLTTSWSYTDANGNTTGYKSDSPHPLQLHSYDDYTLMLNGSGEVILSFSDDYPPDFFTIVKWDAVYAASSQDIENALGTEESVEIIGNSFIISDLDTDYIYQVFARWDQDNISTYAFRIVNS